MFCTITITITIFQAEGLHSFEKIDPINVTVWQSYIESKPTVDKITNNGGMSIFKLFVCNSIWCDKIESIDHFRKYFAQIKIIKKKFIEREQVYTSGCHFSESREKKIHLTFVLVALSV